MEENENSEGKKLKLRLKIDLVSHLARAEGLGKYINIRTKACTPTYAHRHINTPTHTHTYIYTYSHAHTFTHNHTYTPQHTHPFTHIYTYAHRHINTYTFMYRYSCTQPHGHTRIRIQTLKTHFLQAAVVSILLYGCTTWTLTKRLEKNLDGNYTRMLRAILNKSMQQPTRHQLYSHLPPITKTIQVRRTRHAGHCWRNRDELISDVLLWTPTYGRAKAG